MAGFICLLGTQFTQLKLQRSYKREIIKVLPAIPDPHHPVPPTHTHIHTQITGVVIPVRPSEAIYEYSRKVFLKLILERERKGEREKKGERMRERERERERELSLIHI